MATDATSHSAMSTGGPSHSADFLMGTSAVCLWGRQMLYLFNYFANCFFLMVPVVIVFILQPVSNSNHTCTGQVLVNGTGVCLNIASTHQVEGAKVSPTSCKKY